MPQTNSVFIESNIQLLAYKTPFPPWQTQLRISHCNLCTSFKLSHLQGSALCSQYSVCFDSQLHQLRYCLRWRNDNFIPHQAKIPGTVVTRTDAATSVRNGINSFMGQGYTQFAWLLQLYAYNPGNLPGHALKIPHYDHCKYYQ